MAGRSDPCDPDDREGDCHAESTDEQKSPDSEERLSIPVAVHDGSVLPVPEESGVAERHLSDS